MANLSAREVRSLRSYFSKVARVLAGVPVDVLETDDGELGYTTPENSSIYLAFHHDFYASLAKKETISFIKGLFTHELMHRIATNFDVYMRTINSKKDYEQETMSSIINVMEDSSIEYQAPEYASDDFVRCLDFMRAKQSQLLPEIGEEESPFGQFFRACIQFGDTGFLKGDFTSDEAREIFYKALPIMDRSIEELSPSKRAKGAEEVFELSRPLWEEAAKDEDAFKKMLQRLMREHGTAKEDSHGSRHGKPSMMPSSDGEPDGAPGEGDSGSGGTSSEESDRGRDKRRKVTFREVSRKELEKAMAEAKKNGGGSEAAPDGDVEVLYTREPMSTGGAGSKKKPEPIQDDDASKEDGDKAGGSGSTSHGEEPDGKSEDGPDSPSADKKGEKGDGSSGKPHPGDKPSDDGEEAKTGAREEGSSEDGKKGSPAGSDDATDGSEAGKSARDKEPSDKGDAPSDSESGSENDKTGDASSDVSKGNPTLESTDYGDDQDLEGDSSDHNPHEIPAPENASPEMTMREMAESLEEDLELCPEDVEAILQSMEHEAKELDEAKTKGLGLDEEVFDLSVTSGYQNICKNAKCKNVKVRMPHGAAQEQYNALVSGMSADITHLSNELSRIFKQKREEQLYRSSGKVSVKRLSNGRMTPRVFTKRKEPSSSELAVAVAIDISGSMRGTKIANARKCAIALAEVFGRLNIPTYMFGFTADESGCDAVHFHYLNWSNRPADRPALLSISARANNFDGYSIRYASELLKKSDSEHKLLIVISDGEPACASYYGLNNNGILDVKLAIREASKQATVIGVLLEGDNPAKHREMYGYNFIDCQSSRDLFSKLGKAVARQVKEWD